MNDKEEAEVPTKMRKYQNTKKQTTTQKKKRKEKAKKKTIVSEEEEENRDERLSDDGLSDQERAENWEKEHANRDNTESDLQDDDDYTTSSSNRTPEPDRPRPTPPQRQLTVNIWQRRGARAQPQTRPYQPEDGARRKTTTEKNKNLRAASEAKKRLKKLINEGEEKKRLAELVAEGYVDKMGVEGQGRSIEEELEKSRKEKKYVIPITNIIIETNFPSIIQTVTDETESEIDEELSIYDPTQRWALLVFETKEEFEKAEASPFLERIGKRARIEQLAMDKIEGEYKPIRVIYDYSSALPLESVTTDASRMNLNIKYMRRAESGVIIVEFWARAALEEWAKGRIQHQTDGVTRAYKRKKSFMADGVLVHWIGFLPKHVKRNSEVKDQLKRAYGVITKITILRERSMNRSKCCCFARFATPHDLARFLTYGTNKIVLFGRTMTVDKLKPQGGVPEEDM